MVFAICKQICLSSGFGLIIFSGPATLAKSHTRLEASFSHRNHRTLLANCLNKVKLSLPEALRGKTAFTEFPKLNCMGSSCW